MSDKIEKLADIEDEAAFLKAYEKLKADVVTLRAEIKQVEKEKGELETQIEGLSDESVQKYKEKAIRAEIKAQLVDDGVPNPDGVLKYLDLKDMDFDEDDNLTGLDDKLDTLKTDLPILFDKKARAGKDKVDIHDRNPANTQKSTTEQQVDQLFAV